MALQNAQFLNLADPGSTALVKQPADQIDIPQKFNLTGVFELPFGKGRRFANGIPAALDYLIGGWEFDWNVTYMRGWAVAYPNAAQVRPGSAKLDNPAIPMWFDTSLWNDAGTGLNHAWFTRGPRR